MRSPTLRVVTLAVWAAGVGSAIYDGTVPTSWFFAILAMAPSPSHTLYHYHGAEVASTVLLISLETLGLYAIVRWLPTSPALRFLIAAVLSGLAGFYLIRTTSSDGPGILYTNPRYLGRVSLILLVAGLSLLVAAIATRWSAEHGNAA